MNTNDQEAIKEASEQYSNNIIHPSVYRECYADGFIAGATSEAAKLYWLNELGKQQGERWISVDERLPELDTEVLLYFNSVSKVDGKIFHYTITGYLNEIKTRKNGDGFSKSYGYWNFNDSYDDVRPTHWRPLPQPPKH